MQKTFPKKKHKECAALNVSENEVRTYTQHCVEIGMLPKVSLQKPLEVAERSKLYFEICIRDDMKPTIAGWCLALGKHRQNILDICKGKSNDRYPVPAETKEILMQCYLIITAETEQFMVDGKINPVAGIFLMRNHMDYTNEEHLTIRAESDSIPDRDQLIAQAQLLLEQKE